jgi:hypothetical protein
MYCAALRCALFFASLMCSHRTLYAVIAVFIAVLASPPLAQFRHLVMDYVLPLVQAVIVSSGALALGPMVQPIWGLLRERVVRVAAGFGAAQVLGVAEEEVGKLGAAGSMDYLIVAAVVGAVLYALKKGLIKAPVPGAHSGVQRKVQKPYPAVEFVVRDSGRSGQVANSAPAAAVCWSLSLFF